MIIAIDFDGTLLTHTYPGLGDDIGAFPWLREFHSQGAKLILYTMRDGAELEAAIEHCRGEGVEFYAANCNPTQHRWTMSPKVHADLYIDDAAFGVPLIPGPDDRPYVNWAEVGPSVLKLISSRGTYQPVVKSMRYANKDGE